MGREYYINGESLVQVKVGGHAAGMVDGTSPIPASSGIYELGLAAEDIRMQFNFKYIDQKYSEWGTDIPVDVMWNLSDVIISMNLIHFDSSVLDFCFAEAMGGAIGPLPVGDPIGNFYDAGQALSPFGSMLGNNAPLGDSGCHFIGLSILSEQEGRPWNFPSAYIINPVFPLGTKTSIAQVNWRAIPYSPYTVSQFATASGTQTIIYDVLISGINGPVTLWNHASGI